MKVGEIFYPIVEVRSGGAAVTGLTTGDFTVSAWLAAASQSLSFTATELGSGRYRLAITTPTTAGWLALLITSGTRSVSGGRWAGMLRARTIDEVYAQVIRPVTTAGTGNAIPDDALLTLVAYRQQVCTFTRTGLDFTGYTNWRFSVWDQAQLITRYTLSSGITGDALGVVTWTVPEDASFFSQITSAIAAGRDDTTLYWDVAADAGGVSMATRPILRGKLLLRRSEAAA